MASLKDILVQQTSIPLSIESAVPAGVPAVPKVSGMLTSFANSLPELSLPSFALPTGVGLPQVPDFTRGLATIPDIFKGVESAMPAELPKLSESLGGAMGVRSQNKASEFTPPPIGGGYRPLGGPASPTKILGGGYRSI